MTTSHPPISKASPQIMPKERAPKNHLQRTQIRKLQHISYTEDQKRALILAQSPRPPQQLASKPPPKGLTEPDPHQKRRNPFKESRQLKTHKGNAPR